MSRWGYILTIAGIGDPGGGGIVKYCYTGIPGYAEGDTEYCAGLAEPPKGAGSRWDVTRDTVSAGRFTAILRPYEASGDAGPINFQLTQPTVKTKLDQVLQDGGGYLTLYVTSESAQHGIGAGDVIYLERETLRVASVADGSSPTITVHARGYADSEQHEHPAGTDVFTEPPAMVGRKVRCYEVNLDTASSSSDENKILQGYISGEVAAGLHWPSFGCVAQFGSAELNTSPEEIEIQVWRPELAAHGFSVRFPRADLEEGAAPQFIASGGYWLLPSYKEVIAGAYDSGAAEWTPEIRGVYGDSTLRDPDDTGLLLEGTPAYQIAWASLSADPNYCPFKDETGTADDRPITIALNILATKPGSASAADYNLGSAFTQTCALGAETEDIAISEAEELRAFMPGIHAAQFWIGGAKPERLDSVMRRLLSPWGVSVGVSASGQWRFLKLRDFFPATTTVSLTDNDLIEPAQWSQKTLGRQLDEIVIEADANPVGFPTTPQTVEEVTGRRYYTQRLGVKVGDRQRFPDSPYRSVDLFEGSPAWDFVAARVRRLADRVPQFEVSISPDKFGAVDLGTFVELHTVGLRNPTTGALMAAGDDPLRCVCTGVRPDYTKRTARLTLAMLGTGKTCLISPSATIAAGGWNAGTNTATCEPSEFTVSSDVGAFEEGQRVILLDSDLSLRSDDGSTHYNTISAISTGSNTITFSGVFKDSGGATVTPAEGDVIVFCHYDNATAGQIGSYGFLAEDGAMPADPNVGTADVAPYVFGDF